MNKFLICILITISLLLVSCLTAEDNTIRSLNIGDKFIYQEYDHVSIARADKDIVVYRLYNAWNSPQYHYFSTTRKDSIIYDIRSKVKFNK